MCKFPLSGLGKLLVPAFGAADEADFEAADFPFLDCEGSFTPGAEVAEEGGARDALPPLMDECRLPLASEAP